MSSILYSGNYANARSYIPSYVARISLNLSRLPSLKYRQRLINIKSNVHSVTRLETLAKLWLPFASISIPADMFPLFYFKFDFFFVPERFVSAGILITTEPTLPSSGRWTTFFFLLYKFQCSFCTPNKRFTIHFYFYLINTLFIIHLNVFSRICAKYMMWAVQFKMCNGVYFVFLSLNYKTELDCCKRLNIQHG